MDNKDFHLQVEAQAQYIADIVEGINSGEMLFYRGESYTEEEWQGYLEYLIPAELDEAIENVAYMTWGDFLESALDIVEHRQGDTILGFRIYTTIGGPSVYIDTMDKQVVCTWGCDKAVVGLFSSTCDSLTEYLSFF